MLCINDVYNVHFSECSPLTGIKTCAVHVIIIDLFNILLCKQVKLYFYAGDICEVSKFVKACSEVGGNFLCSVFGCCCQW